jgi:hypothetical protein
MDYIEIDRTNCMEIILQEFPAFRQQWEEHLESWSLPIDRPIALDIAEFADFAIEILRLDTELEIEKLTAVTERILLYGNSMIAYAYRTMFLEQIAHRSHKCGFSVDRFTRKLQPLGYYYWQSTDRRVSIQPSGVAID